MVQSVSLMVRMVGAVQSHARTFANDAERFAPGCFGCVVRVFVDELDQPRLVLCGLSHGCKHVHPTLQQLVVPVQHRSVSVCVSVCQCVLV